MITDPGASTRRSATTSLNPTSPSNERAVSSLGWDEVTRIVADTLVRKGLPVRDIRISIVKDSRFRPVAKYAVRCGHGPQESGRRRSFVVKGYFRGGGEATFDAMQQLWTDGFRGTSLLTIAEPFAYVPEHALMIQGVASGRCLHDHLLAPSDAGDTVRATARWLAKLHRSSVPGSAVWGHGEELAKTTHYAQTLAQVAPGIAPRVWELAANAMAGLASGGDRVPVPTHGDFQPKNIYVSRRRVTVIDFDRFALADPARDVGHFVGQSLTMSYSKKGSFDEIRPWVGTFVEEYASRSDPAALRNLPSFVARTFLEVLYYKLFVRPVKDPAFAPLWLDEGERWLDWEAR